MSTTAAALDIKIVCAMTDDQIQLNWPSLLELLGLGAIYLSLPVFDPTNPLFEATVSTLSLHGEREVVHHVYDHLFAECLRQIQTLPQLNAPSLIQAIEKVHQQSESPLSAALGTYETAFKEKPADTMHDLILYLAWDRMCIWMGRLFDHQLSHANFIQALEYLKECLIESYLHISQDGRTIPGIYRMIEALFFFEMREENLQKHSASDWDLLSKSFPALSSQDELIDDYHLDGAKQRLSSWMIDHLGISMFQPYTNKFKGEMK